MPDLSTVSTWVQLIGGLVLIIGIPMGVARILVLIDPKRARRYYLGGTAVCIVLLVVAVTLLVSLGNLLPSSSYSASLRNGDARGWTANNYCVDEGDGLHIKPQSSGGLSCLAPFRSVSDADVSVDANLIAAQAPTVLYGLVFHFQNNGSSNTYEFLVSNTGYWFFTKFVTNQYIAVQPGEINSAIHQRIGSDNRLDVVMRGTHLTFAVNGAQVGEVDDSTLASGLSGVTESYGGESVFSNFQVSAL